MGKVIGILLFVIIIWIGLRSWVGEEPSPSEPERAASRAQQVGERVQGALDSGTERTEKLVPE
jgi:hypothetical protein